MNRRNSQSKRRFKVKIQNKKCFITHEMLKVEVLDLVAKTMTKEGFTTKHMTHLNKDAVIVTYYKKRQKLLRFKCVYISPMKRK